MQSSSNRESGSHSQHHHQQSSSSSDSSTQAVRECPANGCHGCSHLLSAPQQPGHCTACYSTCPITSAEPQKGADLLSKLWTELQERWAVLDLQQRAVAVGLGVLALFVLPKVTAACFLWRRSPGALTCYWSYGDWQQCQLRLQQLAAGAASSSHGNPAVTCLEDHVHWSRHSNIL